MNKLERIDPFEPKMGQPAHFTKKPRSVDVPGIIKIGEGKRMPEEDRLKALNSLTLESLENGGDTKAIEEGNTEIIDQTLERND